MKMSLEERIEALEKELAEHDLRLDYLSKRLEEDKLRNQQTILDLIRQIKAI